MTIGLDWMGFSFFFRFKLIQINNRFINAIHMGSMEIKLHIYRPNSIIMRHNKGVVACVA